MDDAIEWETVVDSTLSVECRHSNLGSETIHGNQLISIIIEQYLSDWSECLLVSCPSAGSCEVQTLLSCWDTVAACKIYASNELHLETNVNELHKVVFSDSLDVVEHDETILDWCVALGKRKGIFVQQLIQCKSELAKQIMVSSLAVIEHLADDLHLPIIVAKFPLGYVDFLPSRISRVVSNLTLVDKVCLVLASLLNSKKWVVATEEIKVGHVRESSGPHIKVNHLQVFAWHHIASDNDFARCLALSVPQVPNYPLLPTSKNLTD